MPRTRKLNGPKNLWPSAINARKRSFCSDVGGRFGGGVGSWVLMDVPLKNRGVEGVYDSSGELRVSRGRTFLRLK